MHSDQSFFGGGPGEEGALRDPLLGQIGFKCETGCLKCSRLPQNKYTVKQIGALCVVRPFFGMMLFSPVHSTNSEGTKATDLVLKATACSSWQAARRRGTLGGRWCRGGAGEMGDLGGWRPRMVMRKLHIPLQVIPVTTPKLQLLWLQTLLSLP